MVPLAQLTVLMMWVIVGVLMMPAEWTWRLPAAPPSIQVRKATLLFAQVSSHAAVKQRLISAHFNTFCSFSVGYCYSHQIQDTILPDVWVARFGKMNDEWIEWLAAVAVQAT